MAGVTDLTARKLWQCDDSTNGRICESFQVDIMAVGMTFICSVERVVIGVAVVCFTDVSRVPQTDDNVELVSDKSESRLHFNCVWLGSLQIQGSPATAS